MKTIFMYEGESIISAMRYKLCFNKNVKLIITSFFNVAPFAFQPLLLSLRYFMYILKKFRGLVLEHYEKRGSTINNAGKSEMLIDRLELAIRV